MLFLSVIHPLEVYVLFLSVIQFSMSSLGTGYSFHVFPTVYTKQLRCRHMLNYLLSASKVHNPIWKKCHGKDN